MTAKLTLKVLEAQNDICSLMRNSRVEYDEVNKQNDVSLTTEVKGYKFHSVSQLKR